MPTADGGEPATSTVVPLTHRKAIDVVPLASPGTERGAVTRPFEGYDSAVEPPENYRRPPPRSVPTRMSRRETATIVIYLSFIGALVWLAIANGARPTGIAAVGILAALVLVVGEVREIRVASWLTIRFGRSSRSADDDR